MAKAETDVTSGLAVLADRFRLDAAARDRLARLLDLLVHDPLAPTAIRGEQAVLDDHLADSLIALDFAPLRPAESVLDLGSGAGLPGLPLATALPGTRFTLLESSSRKCRFLERAIDVCRVSNAVALHARAESFESGREGFDVITARAVAAPPVTAEYAAPLLRVGGVLLMWRGRRDPESELALGAAAAQLGLSGPTIHPVQPYPGVAHRHLYALSKLSQTPDRFPRRPGVALKRPLGAEISRDRRAV